MCSLYSMNRSTISKCKFFRFDGTPDPAAPRFPRGTINITKDTRNTLINRLSSLLQIKESGGTVSLPRVKDEVSGRQILERKGWKETWVG